MGKDNAVKTASNDKEAGYPQTRAKLPDLKNIEVADRFWNRYMDLVTKEVLPYQWKVLNDPDESHCIDNFKIAAGDEKGEFKGFVFQDTDLAKWIEAAAYTLSYKPDAKLEKTIDEAIDLIGRAQQPDGYLDTYFIINKDKKKFFDLSECHELYTAGHFIEAAVAYYKVTGKDSLLKIMEKCADNIVKVFHDKDHMRSVPGHEEVELALVKLYEVTDKKKYLEMAEDFINRRGVQPDALSEERKDPEWTSVFNDSLPYDSTYSQSHEPVRSQNTAEGHAVRAVYLYSAMADVSYFCHDEELFDACRRLYDNITKRRMYITGGIGSSGAWERFTCDYDLPNDAGYSESCASIGLALFSRRMLMLTKEEKYADTMERALYNTVLAGIAMDGKSFFYVNPMEVWPDRCMDRTSMGHVKPVRQKWYPCACCPPNIARTLASLGEYICMKENDSLYLNMYVGCRICTSFDNTPVVVKTESGMPFKGDTNITINAESAVNGTIYLRVPEYAENFSVSVYGNGTIFEKGAPASDHRSKDKNAGSITAGAIVNGYIPVTLKNVDAAILQISYDMKPHFVYANPSVRADSGKACVTKGPLVYCMEEEDNGDHLSNIAFDTDAPIGETFNPTILGGTTVLTVSAMRTENMADDSPLYFMKKPAVRPVRVKLIPYCLWGNRKPGEMLVWANVKQFF